jgi:hypothetical protein
MPFAASRRAGEAMSGACHGRRVGSVAVGLPAKPGGAPRLHMVRPKRAKALGPAAALFARQGAPAVAVRRGESSSKPTGGASDAA